MSFVAKSPIKRNQPGILQIMIMEAELQHMQTPSMFPIAIQHKVNQDEETSK